MSYGPIGFIAPQYEQLNYWLKGYLQGTSTPLSMATDSAAGTLLVRAELGSDGYFKTVGGAKFIPHYNQAYDLFLFPTAAEADANDTSSAIQVADDINPSVDQSQTATNAKRFATLTAAKANDSAALGQFFYVEGRPEVYKVVALLTGTNDDGAYFDITGVTPNLQAEAQFTGNSVSVEQWGAIGSGDETTQLVSAIAAVSVGKEIQIPFAAYKVSSLDIDQNVSIVGLGRANTKITVTGNGTDGDTSALYGIRLIGDVADGLTAVPKLKGMEVELTTATASVHGLLIRRKSIIEDVYVHNGTGDGIYFDSSSPTTSVFFSRFTDVWSKFNIGYGCNVRAGANSNMFINCQFDSNGKDGYIHQADGTATNGNIVIGGQASFNFGRGWNLASGTNFTLSGSYTEFNSNFDLNGGLTHTGTDNASTLTDSAGTYVTNELVGLQVNNTTDGSAGTITANTATTITATLSGGTGDDWDTSDAYTVTALTFVQNNVYSGGELVISPTGVTSAQSAVIYEVAAGYTSSNTGTAAQDFDIDYNAGDLVAYGQEAIVESGLTFSNAKFGLILGNKTHRIRNNFDDTSTEVSLGGSLINRRLDGIRLDVSAGGEASIYFNEAETDNFRIRYNGGPGNPSNELLIESQNSGTWTTVVKLTNNGRLAFFDATTQAQGAHIADPAGGVTIDAEARTSIDAILARLEAFGFSATS